MDGTFIINDQGNPFINRVVPILGITAIEYSDRFNDEEISKYLENIFSYNQIRRLVIPVSLGEPSNNHMGFRLGVHIRVSRHEQIDPLIPIIFVSNRSLEILLMERIDRYGLLAVTPGCVLVKEDVFDLQLNLSALEPVKSEKLVSEVLRRLVISKPETIGPHSLANEWGVLRLNTISRVQALTVNDMAYKRRHNLYFKYQNVLNHALSQLSPSSLLSGTEATSQAPVFISSIQKKVLYIDDEGYKGWESVLKKMFRQANFHCITGLGLPEDDFLSRIRRAIESDWDLILLDLRLLPLREDVHGKVMPIGEYSGTQILNEIKSLNKGTQVIIFTASNKAWNMKELQDLGADGYYIKESPQYLIPDSLSEYNIDAFKKQAELSFKRVYLRNIYKEHQHAIAEQTFTDSDFLMLSMKGLETSFYLLKLELLDAAYLNYFQLMERYAEICMEPLRLPITDANGLLIGTGRNKTKDLTKVDDPSGFSYCEKRNSNKSFAISGALGRLSFVMAFKFGKDDIYLKHLGELVTKRNKIAHSGVGGATITDLFELADLIRLFRANF